jgi:hypothetical protein
VRSALRPKNISESPVFSVRYEMRQKKQLSLEHIHPDGTSPVNICSKYKEINQQSGRGVAREYCVLDLRYVMNYTVRTFDAQP